MRLVLLLLASALASPAATYYLTIAGLGGETEYQQRFDGWAKEIEKILAGTPDATAWTLAGEDARLDNIRAKLGELAARAAAGDAVVVMLIGHGTFDGDDYKFNLPGPDIAASELGQLLDRVKAERQLVVNTTSSSGGSLGSLSRPNRVVITATKSGTERNATVFPRYWIEALRNPEADTDKNEVISALEAYRFALKKTADFYTTEKRIATEHPMLDDAGAGEGSRNPSPQDGQGLLAASFPLLRFGTAQEAAKDPAKRQLLERKEKIEQEIDRLKYQKAAMPLADYRKKLSALLLELAQTQEKIDQ